MHQWQCTSQVSDLEHGFLCQPQYSLVMLFHVAVCPFVLRNRACVMTLFLAMHAHTMVSGQQAARSIIAVLCVELTCMQAAADGGAAVFVCIPKQWVFTAGWDMPHNDS